MRSPIRMAAGRFFRRQQRVRARRQPGHRPDQSQWCDAHRLDHRQRGCRRGCARHQHGRHRDPVERHQCRQHRLGRRIRLGTITGDGNGGDDLVIVLDTGNATPALITTLVRSLTYTNGNFEPSTAIRTISIALDAGGLGSDSATVQVSLVTANNEPTVTATALDPTFTEGGATADLFSSVSVGGLGPARASPRSSSASPTSPTRCTNISRSTEPSS